MLQNVPNDIWESGKAAAQDLKFCSRLKETRLLHRIFDQDLE